MYFYSPVYALLVMEAKAVIFLLSLVYIPSVVEAEAMPPVMFCLVPCIPSICDGGGTYCSSERDQL